MSSAVKKTISLPADLARQAEELAHVAVFLSELAVVVTPKRRLRVVKDDPDNRILECAVDSRAEAIVTGDKALLALKRYERTRVLTLREYLDSR
ncbi:MAG: putative toxin-antitoxin system toxin component, PIN family [Pseudomonadota bacterium]